MRSAVVRLRRGAGALRPLSQDGPSYTLHYTWKLSKAGVVPRQEGSLEGLSICHLGESCLPQKVG